MRTQLALALGALAATLSAHAGAQQLENPRTDYTAYTRPRGRAAVGPLKVEMGIFDELTVGTYPLPWFAFPVLGSPIPNGYLKLRTPWRWPFVVAVRGGLSYIDGSAVAKVADDSASASALSVFGDVDASYQLSEKFTVSLGVDYAHISAVGDSGGDSTSSVEGASTAHTYGVRGFGEWRLNRVFALTLLLRYLIYQSPVSADVDSTSPPVSVTGDLSAESTPQTHFTVVPGVSFVWKRWELDVGAGYGLFYLPFLGLASTHPWPVVDLAAAYRFDLY